MNNNKWWESSTNSGDLALTVKGLLAFLVPLVINFIKTRYPQFDLSEVEVIQALTAIWATFMLIYGLVRKLRNSVV